MRPAPEARESKLKDSPRRRMRRSVFLLPSFFTVGNIFFGYYSILSTIQGNYRFAAYAIGIAIILDVVDGRIARLTNSSTYFGLQLDSLADVISFGIAPSLLALFWGLSSVDPRLAWMASFTFTICGAMRLARFNIQAEELKHFVGLPIPAGGGTVAAIVHFFGEPITNPVGANLMAAGIFFLAFLMISTIRYSSLKHWTLGRKSHFSILIIALMVALIFNFSKPTLLAIALLYSGSGPVHRFYSLFRRKKPVSEATLADSAQKG
ncbi:MAG: CDP-diacylglycerol--serine O-phosphatidyltransferase [Acidobacteria bacterium]|nr:CDP-diacylglycerol--serine O-phosphatidyltransferase [Acidobacteriota bacterium]